MRRLVPLALLFALFVCVASLSAKDDQPRYKTAEVKHFTLGDGVTLPDQINQQDYFNLVYDKLLEEMGKSKLAGQVVAEGATVPDADAADSIVVEGKITDFQKAGHTMMHPAVLSMEIKVYRRSDHTVITTIPPSIRILPAAYRNDKTFSNITAEEAAHEIKKALK
jgi:hypothetical protein